MVQIVRDIEYEKRGTPNINKRRKKNERIVQHYGASES